MAPASPLAPNLMMLWSLFPTGKAYAPEFYYDTYNPLWQNRPRVYSYSLQWTQLHPDAVDRVLAYRLGIRQVSGHAEHRRSEGGRIALLDQL